MYQGHRRHVSWLTSSVFHSSWPKPEGQRELWSITLTASMTMTEWKNKVFFICHLLPKMIRHKILSKCLSFGPKQNTCKIRKNGKDEVKHSWTAHLWTTEKDWCSLSENQPSRHPVQTEMTPDQGRLIEGKEGVMWHHRNPVYWPRLWKQQHKINTSAIKGISLEESFHGECIYH